MTCCGENETAKQILRYFVRNPNAADNLEGIVRWRLLEETIHHSVGETQQALTWLVSQGFLSESCVGGTEKIFLLNRERKADAQCFLTAPDPVEGSGSGLRIKETGKRER